VLAENLTLKNLAQRKLRSRPAGWHVAMPTAKRARRPRLVFAGGRSAVATAGAPLGAGSMQGRPSLEYELLQSTFVNEHVRGAREHKDVSNAVHSVGAQRERLPSGACPACTGSAQGQLIA
jgi:hypothetical protein